MKKILFPLLIALSALSVAGCAAFYSVFGLSKLFAGAQFEVILMAGSLEVAKLVVASLLYQYWTTINKFLRAYFLIAVFVLMMITSGGIYGFLSNAYQQTAVQSELLDKGLAVLQQKQTTYQDNKKDFQTEKLQLNQSISDLRISLSNPHQVQYIDRETQQLITTSSSSARRDLKKELALTIKERDTVNKKLEIVQDSILKIDVQLVELQISNEEQRELGPLKYISALTGKPMDRVVNWFLLLIIFVFDPLAIAMIVAMNFAFSRGGRTPTLSPISPTPKMPPIYKGETTPPVAVTTEPSVELKKRVKEHQSKFKDKEPTSFVPIVLSKEEQTQLSTVMGKKEKDISDPAPIKPTPQDLKKLEEALGLNKKEGEVGKTLDSSLTPSPSGEMEESKAERVKAPTSRSLEQAEDPNKKVLKYIKRGSDNT